MELLLPFQTYLQVLIYLHLIYFPTFKLDIVPLLFFHVTLPSPLTNYGMTGMGYGVHSIHSITPFARLQLIQFKVSHRVHFSKSEIYYHLKYILKLRTSVINATPPLVI